MRRHLPENGHSRSGTWRHKALGNARKGIYSCLLSRADDASRYIHNKGGFHRSRRAAVRGRNSPAKIPSLCHACNPEPRTRPPPIPTTAKGNSTFRCKRDGRRIAGTFSYVKGTGRQQRRQRKRDTTRRCLRPQPSRSRAGMIFTEPANAN